MLNTPNCISDKDIPLEITLTGPYNSMDDLELIRQISLNDSSSIINTFDFTTLSQELLHSNSCDIIRKKYKNVLKYCRICKYYDLNVLSRLENELKLLNHVYHNGPDERFDENTFQYYVLDQYNDICDATKEIFGIIVSKQDNKELLDSILLSLFQDDNTIRDNIKIFIDKIIERKINFDIDLCIDQLTNTATKKTYSSNIMKQLMAAKESTNSSTSLGSSDIANKSDKKISKQTIEKIIKKPRQREKNDNNPINQLSVLNELEHFTSVHDNEKKVKTNVSDIPTTVCQQTQEAKNNQINYHELQSICISKGEVYVSTKRSFSIAFDIDNITSLPYEITNFNEDATEFIKLLFANNNIVKVVDDISTLAQRMNLTILVSTLDMSLISDSEYFISTYKEKYKKFSVDELKSLKRKTQLKILKRFQYSSLGNVIFKVEHQSDFFDDVLYTAYCKKVFDKFDVKVGNLTSKSLELLIEGSTKPAAIDYFLSIIRTTLKLKGLGKSFEVIIK
ncbi:MAG: hypothetical protein IBX70_12125 [Clostridia bacterium]|nr:hypothetical protein [Clostridia bacterium]